MANNNKENLINQVFGTRKIIKNECIDEDWIKISKPIPTEKNRFKLTQCLNCGAIFPSDIRNIRKQPPKKCTFCSNICNHYNLKTNTNNWVKYDDYAACNVNYNSQIITFYIDLEDYTKVSQLIWRISQKKQKYYVLSGSSKKNTNIYLHNFILPNKEGYEIDHIDGNSLNNRKNNLRYVNHQINVDNTLATRIDNQIGIRGVSYNQKANKYKTDFTYHEQRYYFKDWTTVEEAIYCRYCCEKEVGLEMLEKNPNFKYYDFSNINTKAIESYVREKISGN